MVVINPVLSVLLPAFFTPSNEQRKPNICILFCISSDLLLVNPYCLSSSLLRHWALHNLWRRRHPRRLRKFRLRLLWKRFLHIFRKHHKTDHPACSLSWEKSSRDHERKKKKTLSFFKKYPAQCYTVRILPSIFFFLQDKIERECYSANVCIIFENYIFIWQHISFTIPKAYLQDCH